MYIYIHIHIYIYIYIFIWTMIYVYINSKSSPPLPGPPQFVKIPHPPTLPANWSSQVLLINRNATVKLSSINTIHVKQQQFSFSSSL